MAYYFTCKRCEYFTKYKIDMKRHYEKQKKCKLKDETTNYSDAEFYELSLVKNEYSPNDLIAMNNNAIIEEKNDPKKNYCSKCDMYFSKTFNYNRHIKTNKCKINEIDTDINNIVNNNIINNNTVNNPIINNQYININVNMNNNNIKGFDEKWDLSKIDKFQMSGLLTSNHKFSNTLQKILENEANLNVIVNKDVGIVYKSENDKYEVISKKELMKQTIDKIYQHLNEFYNELINSDFEKETDFFDKHIKNIKQSYNRYYYKTEDFKNKADEALLFFYNQVKEEAEKKYVEKLEEKTKIEGFII
jgi:hypothetical protein